MIQPKGSIDSNNGRRYSGFAFNEENNAHSYLAVVVARESFKRMKKMNE